MEGSLCCASRTLPWSKPSWWRSAIPFSPTEGWVLLESLCVYSWTIDTQSQGNQFIIFDLGLWPERTAAWRCVHRGRWELEEDPQHPVPVIHQWTTQRGAEKLRLFLGGEEGIMGSVWSWSLIRTQKFTHLSSFSSVWTDVPDNVAALW